MVTAYWIFWIISLLIFILSYCIASCKYEALTNGYSAFPNIELSKENPKHRKKIPIKLWYVVLAFILLWIPVFNTLACLIYLINALVRQSDEFILPKENKLINLFAKLGNFLNRDIS